MKRANQYGDAHTVGVVTLAVIIAGVLGYAIFQGYIKAAMQKEQSSASNNKTVAAMQRLASKGMSRSDVDTRIGTPFKCDDIRSVKIANDMREVQHCHYGNPSAREYLTVVYMDGKIWGTSHEERGER